MYETGWAFLNLECILCARNEGGKPWLEAIETCIQIASGSVASVAAINFPIVRLSSSNFSTTVVVVDTGSFSSADPETELIVVSGTTAVKVSMVRRVGIFRTVATRINKVRICLRYSRAVAAYQSVVQLFSLM